MSQSTVRLLIDDQDSTSPVFTDEEITHLLALHGGNPLRAAAQALLILAGSEVRLSKKIQSQDLAVDGAAVAAELRAQAKQLRDQADEEDAVAGEGSAFEIIEYPYRRPGRPELAEHQRW